MFEQIICIQVGTQSTNLITHNVCVCGGFIHSSASCPAHLIQYNIMLRTKEAMRTNNNNCPVIKTQRFRHTHTYICMLMLMGRQAKAIPNGGVVSSNTFSIFARFLFPSLYPSLSRSECLFPYFAFMFVTMFNKCYKSRCFAWFFFSHYYYFIMSSSLFESLLAFFQIGFIKMRHTSETNLFSLSSIS